MIKVLEHPLVSRDISVIRDERTSPSEFRNAISRIASHLAIEAYYNINVEETQVKTPLEVTKGCEISNKVLLIPILRAGLSLLDSFEQLYPNVQIGYCALKRNEKTFESEEYYYSIPKFDDNTVIIILEVMLATGGSILTLLSKLQLEGATNIKVVAVVSAPEGLEKIASLYPNIEIITAVIDRELNDKKYILPGLGDAGDRLNNTL